MTKEEVLQQCIIEGNIVKLPGVQLDRKLYMEVAKALELIGGKWKGGKIAGFVFPQDPKELLEQIANGEKRNLKKEYQFFATPKELVDELVFQAQIEPFHRILEPSAGQGAIINGCSELFPGIKQIDCCELMDVNRIFLNKIDAALIIADDFLTLPEAFNNKYDRIIANPPFSKNQDIDHIYKMFDCLKESGRIVTVASSHWVNSTNKKEMEFKQWLKLKNADYYEIEPGRFKESGTMVGAIVIILNK
jgi:hypothetical protein